jgi:predicted acetyltransferase
MAPIEISRVELTPITRAELPVLGQLVQLYVYDFSELISLDVGPDGRFPFRDLEAYFTDEWRHPYFIYADGQLAGFALLHARGFFDASPDVWDVAQFFVMRRYRRLGVGERAAVLSFRMFDGTWQVRERDTNIKGIAFWRKVIARYTRERFREIVMDDEQWRGPVQTFDGAA